VNNLLFKYHEKLKYINLLLIVFLFPLNQQFHLRPFPSVQGIIIDYLIIKISLPEILLISLTILNLDWILKATADFKSLIIKYWYLMLVLFLLVTFNIYQSNYFYLAIYENLILLLIIVNCLTVRYFRKIDLANFTAISMKFWMVILFILGSLQFYFQESVLDSYYFFGEFTYSSDNYHIKQDGFLIKNLIPAYGIFSHSNIFGAFFLICSMFLHIIRRNNLLMTLIAILGVLLSGSLNILLGFIVFLIFFYLRIDTRFLVAYLILMFFTLNFMSQTFEKYQDDLSIYRRLYMLNLSNIQFYNNPTETFFGFGYYNYFKKVSDDLYYYEIIRFFQPPHNVLYLLVWNYGLLFVAIFLFLFTRFFIKLEPDYKIFFLVIFAISMLDHFLFTNHQLKMLLFLILPYSLKRVFSIKIN